MNKEPVLLTIQDIKPYQGNAKKHPKWQLRGLMNIVKEVGWRIPILVDHKTGTIITGHGRWETWNLYQEVIKPIWIVDDMGRTIHGEIETTPMTEQQQIMYRIADNRLQETGWENEMLREDIKLLEDKYFEMTGFDKDLITEPEVEDDNIPVVEKSKAKLGDIFQLGEHILMCGDSISKLDVDTLMGGGIAQCCFTDPPYNVDYRGGMGTHKQNKRSGILNDKMTKDKFHAFLSEMSKRIIENVDGGVYICMSSSELDTLKSAWENNGGHWQSFIIWVKNNFTLSRADYQNTYEPMLYGWPNKTKNHYFIEDRDKANVWEDLREIKTSFDGKHTSIKFQGFEVKVEGKVKGMVKRKSQYMDIWRYDKPVKSPDHPTSKPVALCMEAIKNSSRRNDIVLDLFGGSGSTLIACEKLQRKCRMMELDPHYVDIILYRYSNYSGIKPIKLN